MRTALAEAKFATPVLISKPGTVPEPLPWNDEARSASVIALVLADVAAGLAAIGVIFVLRSLLWGASAPFWALWAAGVGWIVFRAASGLYPPVGITQPEELRRSFRTSAAAALIHWCMLLALQELSGPRLAGLGVWVLVVPFAYFARSFAKIQLIRRKLFGTPFVVIGTGEKAAHLIREMRALPELGMVPVAVFGDRAAAEVLEGIPILGRIEDAERIKLPYHVTNAIIVLGRHEAGLERIGELLPTLGRQYPNLHLLSELTSSTNMWVQPRSIGSDLVLEIRQARFSHAQQRLKRAFDLLVAAPVFLLSLPLIALGAITVKLASPGPAFFSQVREGRSGQPIRIWKLRTMVTDAESRLAEHLVSNPAARREWERTLKLRNDPRVIPRVGSFLRRSSIDELPQLWSVIRGDMSLVGPRIMPSHEVELYTDAGRTLRRDVPPGLSGLWQIMYRNNSDLRIREVADSYYVNNWSVWLDAWILLRTVRTVLNSAGAY